MTHVLAFIKKNTVMTIAFAAALITSFIVPVDEKYLGYFDYKTLACLFCVLAVVCALKDVNFFYILAEKVVERFKNLRICVLALVYITFIGSMLIANDMALLTFLPLGYFVLSSTGKEKYMAYVFILQNVSANLGGMLTPFGNPQNLYLYSISGAGLGEFIGWMAPYTLVSGVLLLLVVFVLSAGKRRISLETGALLQTSGAAGRKKNGIYLALFVLSLLSVARVLPWELMLAVVLIVLIFTDRAVFLQVDYCLLLTFVFFFIFCISPVKINLYKC